MSDSVPLPSKPLRLRLETGPLGPDFAALCAIEGVKPQAMIQQLIAERLAAQRARPDPRHRPAPGVSDGAKLRRELRFTQSELDVLEAAALRHGGSIRDYIVSIARAHAADALVGKEERALLGKINYQLLAIGRNINQIAHRANAFDGVTQQQLDELGFLGDALKVLSSKVHKHLLAGRERWRIISD